MGSVDDKYRKDLVLGMVADLAFQLNKACPIDLELAITNKLITKEEMVEVFEEQLDVLFP